MTKIKVGIDADLEDLIPQFLDNRKKDIDALILATQQQDIEAVSQLSHKIKGAALSFGFTQMGHLASEIETLAKANQTLNLHNLALKMKEEFASVEIYFVQD